MFFPQEPVYIAGSTAFNQKQDRGQRQKTQSTIKMEIFKWKWFNIKMEITTIGATQTILLLTSTFLSLNF